MDSQGINTLFINHTEKKMIMNSLMLLSRNTYKHINAFVSIQTSVHFIKHRKFWKSSYCSRQGPLG